MCHKLSYNQYEVKLASTVEEAVKLVEVGFEYVTEMVGKNCLGAANKVGHLRFIKFICALCDIVRLCL